jgi:hypothetical protein
MKIIIHIPDRYKKWLNQNENYKRWDLIRKIGISYNPQMGLGRGYGLDPTAN